MKRLFDLIVASIGLVLVSPLLLVLAALIKLDSSGPVFYRGLRAGRFGAPFRIFKFRTMIHDPMEHGDAWTASDDPRITRFGANLRRYKFDELPQLINVVRGEMSLVGPRPEVMDEVRRYTDMEKQLLTLRPGMTDWASAKFCQEGNILRNSQDPVSYYNHQIRPEKVRLGLEYVRNNSLWVDIRIIFHTLARLVREEHATVSKM